MKETPTSGASRAAVPGKKTRRKTLAVTNSGSSRMTPAAKSTACMTRRASLLSGSSQRKSAGCFIRTPDRKAPKVARRVKVSAL